ncbi:MAG: DUF433 domain-containing protein [Xenococcaceae cyanobacterium]
MSTVTDIGTIIVRTPETCGGRPRIAGMRVSVQAIAVLYKQGMSPEEIAEEFEFLNLAQIYAALAYYHANKEEIEIYLAEEKAEYDQFCSDDATADYASFYIRSSF